MRFYVALGVAAVIALGLYLFFASDSKNQQAPSAPAPMAAPVQAKPAPTPAPVTSPAETASPAPEPAPVAAAPKPRVKRARAVRQPAAEPAPVTSAPEPAPEPQAVTVAAAPEPADEPPAPAPDPGPDVGSPAPVVAAAPAPATQAESAYAPPSTAAVLAAAVFGDVDKYQKKHPVRPIERKVESYADLDKAVADIGHGLTADVPADKSLAVTGIVAMNSEARDNQLGAIASEMLTTKAIQAGGPKVAEKSQVNKVLGELEMSSLGLTQERDLTKAGLILGVDYMVAGSIVQQEDESVLMITKVDTASGRTIATWEAHIPNAATQPLVDEYVEKRTKTDALYRSMLFPGWGQFYNGQDLKGGMFVGTGVALIGLTAFQYARFIGAEEAYQNAGSEAQAAQEYARGESLAGQTYVLLGITGAFWLLNGLDAYIYGSEDSRVKEGVDMGLNTPYSGGYGFSLAYRW